MASTILAVDDSASMRQMVNFITTESSQDKKMQGKQAGATGWIVKPFNPDQLLATIARVL